MVAFGATSHKSPRPMPSQINLYVHAFYNIIKRPVGANGIIVPRIAKNPTRMKTPLLKVSEVQVKGN